MRKAFHLPGDRKTAVFLKADLAPAGSEIMSSLLLDFIVPWQNRADPQASVQASNATAAGKLLDYHAMNFLP